MKRTDLAWATALTVAGTALGLVLLCIAPFSAVAAIAVRTLSRRAAICAVVAMWVVNQAIGFGWHRYPRDGSTIAWGIAILLASLVAVLAASAVRPPFVAYIAAFAGYEATLFAWAAHVNERGAFTPDVVFEVFVGDLFGFAVLTVLRRLVRGGSERYARG